MIKVIDGSENSENQGRGEIPRPGFDTMVGHSKVWQETVNLARKLATSTEAPVLITGEAGTGKQLLARAMHYAGPNPQEPFVSVDCSALPAHLLESELCGRENGALPSQAEKIGLAELAGEGTLFLYEVGELSASLQERLVQLLENHTLQRVGGSDDQTIRCRIMASTSRTLPELVALGRFREDLFSRLSVYRIDMPPLRERGDDIRWLAQHFLEEIARDADVEVRHLKSEAVEALENHRWPGNVRELKDVIHRAHAARANGRIGADDLTVQVRWRRPATEEGARVVETIRIPESGKPLDHVEAEAIQATLDITDGNQSAASRILGISRPTLARKIRRYDLRIPGRGRPSDGAF